jgi:hypothetical protein
MSVHGSRPSRVWGRTGGPSPAPRCSLKASSARFGGVGGPLQLAFGRLNLLALLAQFLQPSPDGREIVGCAGSVHGCSSHLAFGLTGTTPLCGAGTAGRRRRKVSRHRM